MHLRPCIAAYLPSLEGVNGNPPRRRRCRFLKWTGFERDVIGIQCSGKFQMSSQRWLTLKVV
jgi:hypothetical protein